MAVLGLTCCCKREKSISGSAPSRCPNTIGVCVDKSSLLMHFDVWKIAAHHGNHQRRHHHSRYHAWFLSLACCLRFSCLVLSLNSSNSPGCILRSPASHCCHVRNDACTRSPASVCVKPAAVLAARMSSGSGGMTVIKAGMLLRRLSECGIA
jgi:hypothetical protein